MTSQRFTLRAAAYLLLIKDNQVLLLRRYKTGWKDGEYTLIAGHLDGNEPVTSTMTREALEEAGIKINPKDLQVVHTMHRNGDKEYIDFFLTTDKWKGEPSIMEPNKADDIGWFSINNLPKNLLPHVRHAILSYQKGITYSEVDWS